MNMQARKLKFIQEFINLNDEELIQRLEQVLHEEEIEPYALEEFDAKIDGAEEDENAGRVTVGEDVIKSLN